MDPSATEDVPGGSVEPGTAAPGSALAPDDGTVDERTIDPDPLVQFGLWYRRAAEVVVAPESMALATADAQGRPSVRMVLLKSWGDDGFVFFTNYDGRKSHDLIANPQAALLFYWEPLGRQVRVEGAVSRTTDAESDAYYASRDLGSRVGAYASHQSQPIASRADLDASVEHWTTELRDGAVPRPPWWGGWRITPQAYEFWQQGQYRLHDRVRYEADGPAWTIDRLQP